MVRYGISNTSTLSVHIYTALSLGRQVITHIIPIQHITYTPNITSYTPMLHIITCAKLPTILSTLPTMRPLRAQKCSIMRENTTFYYVYAPCGAISHHCAHVLTLYCVYVRLCMAKSWQSAQEHGVLPLYGAKNGYMVRDSCGVCVGMGAFLCAWVRMATPHPYPSPTTTPLSPPHPTPPRLLSAYVRAFVSRHTYVCLSACMDTCSGTYCGST